MGPNILCYLGSHISTLLPLFINISFQGTWHTLFLESKKVLFINNSYTLYSRFSFMRMITPVCQFFGVFPSFHVISLTLFNHCTPMFNAFNISGQISSLPTAISDFNPHMAAATSINVKTSSFPKSIVLHVPVAVAFRGFNKSLKYCLYYGVPFAKAPFCAYLVKFCAYLFFLLNIGVLRMLK